MMGKMQLEQMRRNMSLALFYGYCNVRYYNIVDWKFDAESLASDDGGDTYYWKDVDYTCQKRGNWEVRKHYERTQGMIVQGGAVRLENDLQWREWVIGLFRYMTQKDFLNPNWWHNQIGNPQAIANMMLMLSDYLTADDKKQGLRIVARGSIKTPDTEGIYARSVSPINDFGGANILWVIVNSFKHAVLTEDLELVQRVVKRACSELIPATEGIQPDGSFTQHSCRWYSGGYGRAFTYEMALLIYCLQGTDYQLPMEKLEFFMKHVLDGQRYMLWRGYFDYGAVGRELSKVGFVKVWYLTAAVKLLAETRGLPRQDEIREFWRELEEEEQGPLGTKWYPGICLLRHAAEGGYISVRGIREGLMGAEQINDEGVLCYNMTYGTNICLMRKGDEYNDLSPVWDFAKMPGTTARIETDKQLMEYWQGETGISHDCTADGMTVEGKGMMYEKVSHDGISLTASWFVFDGCLVALGTGIRDEAPEKGAVFTTINQCRLDDFIVSPDGVVKNGGWCYRNLDRETRFQILAQKQTGAWSRNSLHDSDAAVEEDVFTITIPFEKMHPSYAYFVGPEEKEISVTVIRNDGGCQAIAVNDSFIMAVFHQDTSLEWKGQKMSGHAGSMERSVFIECR